MAYTHFSDTGDNCRFSELVHSGKANAEEDRRTGEKTVDENQVIRQLKRANWLVLGILSLGGLLAVNPFFSLSILIGGLIIIANFNLLHLSILRCTVNPRISKSSAGILALYYLRFIGTGLVVAVLMIRGWIAPVGLVVGLSTVMLTIVVCGFFIIKRAWIEEA
jgi:small-conductance mechanosensitive channel